MTVDVSGALRKFSNLERKISGLEARLPGLMTAEAAKTGEASLRRSVYGQAPGRYHRTGTLRALFKVSPNGRGIGIVSGAPYASRVEGVDISTVTFDPRTGKVTGLGSWQPSRAGGAYMGRTVRMWHVPGPHVAPAAMRALWVARREILKAIKEGGR